MFHLCLSLAHLLTLCHIEATSRRGTDPPALQGYHRPPPPSSPVISSAFALWANTELYILGPSLPFFLSFFLSSFPTKERAPLARYYSIYALASKSVRGYVCKTCLMPTSPPPSTKTLLLYFSPTIALHFIRFTVGRSNLSHAALTDSEEKPGNLSKFSHF